MAEPFYAPVDTALPHTFSTDRLVLRVPQAGDGPMVNAIIRESFEALHRWMPWARRVQTVAESETFAREAAARFRAREEITYLLLRAADHGMVGCASLHSLDWSVPRFEIGYWLGSAFEGHGYMTETVRALTALCLHRLGAERVEIRCDSRNARSAAVATRAGYQLEATLRRHMRDNEGRLRDTLVFARFPE